MRFLHPSKGRRAVAVALMIGAAFATVPSIAQTAFPEKQLTWIVGFPPGGTVDVMTRLVARKLEQAIGRPVVVNNRPGASGSIALNVATDAAPDGHTLVTVPGPVLTKMPLPQVGKALMGVAMLGTGPMVLVGAPGPSAPVDLAAIVASAKAAPDRFSFGSSGNGTSQHLAGELINQVAGIRMTHVPYKGGGQAVTDVIGGQVPLAMLGITPVLPHIKSGKLRAYGVSTAKRSPAIPDTPTLAEAGLPGFDASQWFVVAVPTGVPADRLNKLGSAIAAVLEDPEIVAGFAGVGVVPVVASPQQTTDFVTADLKRWRELAEKSGLSLD